MAAFSPAKTDKQASSLSPSCSVCLEPVTDGGERSIAKLKCGHHFHLDCIGSAFNAKGTMQCPNCRHIEDGQWLYANGCRRQEDFMLEDMIYDESFDIYAGVSELFLPHEEMHFGHVQWCPYRSSYPHFSLSVEEVARPPAGYADLIVNVLVGEHASSLNSMHPCPFVQTQGTRVLRHLLMSEESVTMPDIASSSQHGTPIMPGTSPRQAPLPHGGRWVQHNPTHMAVSGGIGPNENGVMASMHPHDRSRWPRPNDRFSGPGSSFPVHFAHSSVHQRPEVTTGVAEMRSTLPHGQNHNMLGQGQNHNMLGQGAVSQPSPQFGNYSSTSAHSRRPRVRALSQTPRAHLAHPPEGMVMHRPTNWGTPVSAVGQETGTGGIETGHIDGPNLVPWRRDGSSVIPLFPLEPEAQRWMQPPPPPPPPPPGTYHSDDMYGADLTMQAGIRVPEGSLGGHFQGPFPVFPPFLSDAQSDIGSLHSPSLHPSR